MVAEYLPEIVVGFIGLLTLAAMGYRGQPEQVKSSEFARLDAEVARLRDDLRHMEWESRDLRRQVSLRDKQN
ncbi:hypothetical protein [Saccharopolyspora hattusasensis]|uniref:hypothetical protein n=1 Tax=Saccharopolyspora hattusasensis TaxID=1128679 RepID=UPI003D995532